MIYNVTSIQNMENYCFIDESIWKTVRHNTIGFEPSWLKSIKAIAAIKKWSHKSAKEENEDKQINVIWFCVDGTSRKLFPNAIKDLSRSISMWKSVPIIVVITKSYSVPERTENIELVNKVFSQNKDLYKRLRKIIPVVASPYILNDTASAPPEGITELIDATNELMPEGFKAAKNDISRFNLGRKRTWAQGAIVASVGSAVAKCFINLGTSDSLVLSAIENALVDSLSKIYNVDKNSKVTQIIKNNIANGTVNKFAKTAISLIEKLPVGQKLGSTIINPIIAASVVILIGESAAMSFEKIYLGNDDNEEIEKIEEVFESDVVSEIVEQVKIIGDNLTPESGPKEITQAATNFVNSKKSKKQ